MWWGSEIACKVLVLWVENKVARFVTAISCSCQDEAGRQIASCTSNHLRLLLVMKASELKRWLKAQGCTLEEGTRHTKVMLKGQSIAAAASSRR